MTSILIGSGFHLPEINIFYGINCKPNEIGLSLLRMRLHAIRFQEFYQGLFSSPRQKDPGNEVGEL